MNVPKLTTAIRKDDIWLRPDRSIYGHLRSNQFLNERSDCSDPPKSTPTTTRRFGGMSARGNFGSGLSNT